MYFPDGPLHSLGPILNAVSNPAARARLIAAYDHCLAEPQTVGERIRIEGHVLDGDRLPVPDALVEIWQANAHGRYHHPGDHGPAPLASSFVGFGRSDTENEGETVFFNV